MPAINVTEETVQMLERGFAIFPLTGKKAFLPGGFHDATTNRDVLNRQAKKYPGCNWGGICDGVMVLDEDPRNGGNLESIGVPDVLDTLVVRTGSGGRHAYFRHEGKVRGKLDQHEGIDLKTWRTGYTVMPGSIHPETDQLYRIERDLPIANLPQELLPLVTPPVFKPQPIAVNPERRSDGLVRKVADATDGGRNAITYWALCRALERGSSDLVPEIRSAALNTGLTEREFDTCLRSAQRTTGRAA
ncbi:bifunctional DNA primase/polymerase [Rhodococcus sp. IEGM 1379]|uniref:bifunctional DNA primase/polymerase n=1 Tax=Rhodococcus sp. IEGM 1379 TaxID=3047086 RepID=UPI0024B826FB|nr:bifunctional DNA primase/polymerase [Rhodococcus sp. IEGM 1379]MDI9917857.1 bifunctional DNA primase/polymerase [Rhodococcus sp. IEGM 1379]